MCWNSEFHPISYENLLLMKYSLAMRLRCMLCKCICIHLYLHLKTSCICRINQRLLVSVCVHKLYCGCALHNVQSVITNSGLCTFFSSPTNFPLFTFFSDCRKITMMISTVADDDDNDDWVDDDDDNDDMEVHDLRILCQPLFFWIYCNNISFEIFRHTGLVLVLFTLGSTVHDWGWPKNGPFWTKNGKTWQACQLLE